MMVRAAQFARMLSRLRGRPGEQPHYLPGRGVHRELPRDADGRGQFQCIRRFSDTNSAFRTTIDPITESRPAVGIN